MFDARSIPAWTEEALCAQVGGDLWFPEGTGASARPAKEVCGMCPVRAECLDFSIAEGIRFGVWGGVSERARRKMITERAA